MLKFIYACKLLAKSVMNVPQSTFVTPGPMQINAGLSAKLGLAGAPATLAKDKKIQGREWMKLWGGVGGSDPEGGGDSVSFCHHILKTTPRVRQLDIGLLDSAPIQTQEQSWEDPWLWAMLPLGRPPPEETSGGILIAPGSQGHLLTLLGSGLGCHSLIGLPSTFKKR